MSGKVCQRQRNASKPDRTVRCGYAAPTVPLSWQCRFHVSQLIRCQRKSLLCWPL